MKVLELTNKADKSEHQSQDIARLKRIFIGDSETTQTSIDNIRCHSVDGLQSFHVLGGECFDECGEVVRGQPQRRDRISNKFGDILAHLGVEDGSEHRQDDSGAQTPGTQRHTTTDSDQLRWGGKMESGIDQGQDPTDSETQENDVSPEGLPTVEIDRYHATWRHRVNEKGLVAGDRDDSG